MFATALHELTFPAMGSTAHLAVDGDPGLLERARAEIGRLEGLWSRFLETSEISLLNRDRSSVVSPETVTLVAHLVEAWRATGGRFDPTMARAIEAAGYDRSFDDGLDAHGHLAPLPASGCDGVVVDHATGRVDLPEGVELDPGGLGKGLAADMVAEMLHAQGASCLVNVGGDLRALGPGPVDGDWVVEIEEPAVQPERIASVRLPADAALATSTPLRRRWRRGRRTAHHLLDPLTGLPHARVARLVTVVAADAWWAEAVTKQLIGAAPDEARRIIHDASALVIDHDGQRHLIGGMEDYLA